MRRSRKTLAILGSAVAVAGLTAGCADTMAYLGASPAAESQMTAGENPCGPCHPCGADNPCAGHNP